MKKLLSIITLSSFLNSLALAAPPTNPSALIDQLSVSPGLAVVLDDVKGGTVSDLAGREGLIVQALTTQPEQLAATRRSLAHGRQAGRVSVHMYDGMHLPYVDRSVNLLVAATTNPKRKRAFQQEILRVLAPGGVVLLPPDTDLQMDGVTPEPAGDFIAFRKPIQQDTDEWSHYHHDPQGTMVAQDRVVGPPARIQWLGGPKWLRNHDFMASMHAMVSSGGRVFYIIDEGLRNHIFLPAQWTLIARDAFNGTILWKRPLKDWHPNNWPLKSGPGDLPRRIVATPDRVFVTLGLNQPLSKLDAATGKLLHTYGDTRATEEILCEAGTLYLCTNPERKPVNYRAEGTSYKEIGRANSGWAWSPEKPDRILMAVEVKTGKIRWQHHAPVAPLSLTLGGGRVYFHDGTRVVALDAATGNEQWKSVDSPVKKVSTGGSLRMVYWEGVLLFANGINLQAFAADDGHSMWKEKLQRTSHHCPEDLFVIDGLIWSPRTGTPQKAGTHFKVIDARTGKIARDFVANNLPAFPMHPRCYPSKATSRYLITNGMGAEFYELGSETLDIFNYLRGSCIYGLMPCNGLLYKPPDSCACYYQSKLEYLCALAPANERVTRTGATEKRLEKGPAFTNSTPAASTRLFWPMYRGDMERSGFTAAPVAASLKKAWNVPLHGKLTQPIVAGKQVYVAEIDRHTLHAFDTGSGEVTWTFHAGGRIDSSPTLHRDRLYFGCADGWVYCLRARDGILAWRYRVAPSTEQMVSRQQLESVWPLHGSVLIVQDQLYALAGRNMFFDGGLHLVRLDPNTGRLLSETVMDENDPATGKNLQTLIKAKYMPIANPDILSSDGKRIYMQEQNIDLNGKRIGLEPTIPSKQAAASAASDAGNHLFCQTGLLDDLWFHRSYWIYGADCGEGWGAYANPRNSLPTGRLMVMDDSRIYAFRAGPLGNMLHPRQSYELYAIDRTPGELPPKSKSKNRRASSPTPLTHIGRYKVHWQETELPLLAHSMALTGTGQDQVLFIAGPPDLADERKMLGYLPGADDDINRQLKAQEEAWQGKRGGLLRAVSAHDGSKLAEYKLDSYPLFDALSAADGKLFMSMKDGSLECWMSEP